ncbi:MAG: hypothetical protein N3A38_16620, partial [Planctomycetota bacterium]|nr:hypothetical protein [Planctomycetota bacterium]
MLSPGEKAALSAILAVIGAAFASAGEEIPIGEAAVLWSGNEEQIIEYLKCHYIPTIHGGAPSGPLPDHREIQRALVLFKAGSPRLRLAIAESLRECETELQAKEFWESATEDDVEARHWLVGTLLHTVAGEQARMMREWLLKRANPNYAVPLLSHLSEYSLYRDLNTEGQDAFIPLLEQLWRQTGEVVPREAPSSYRKRATVQSYVASRIPFTARGRDLLLRWMVNESKKLDERTLDAMWARWHEFSLKPDLVDRSLADHLALRLELVESWLLSPSPRHDPLPNYREANTGFRNLARHQVLNPDDRVRRKAIEYVLRYDVDEGCFALIRAL